MLSMKGYDNAYIGNCRWVVGILLWCWLPAVAWTTTENTHPADSLSLQALQNKAVAALLRDQPDSSSTYYQQARTLATAQRDFSGLITLVKAYGRAYRDQRNEPEKAIGIFYQGLPDSSLLTPQSAADWEALAGLCVNLAYTLDKAGKFNASVMPYEMALYSYDNHLHEESPYVALYVYRALANVYTRLGEYQAAETLLLRTLKVLGTAPASKNYAAETCSDLGLLYEAWGQPLSAIEKYRAGLLLASPGSVSEAILHANLAKVYYPQGTLEDVTGESVQAILILQQYDPAQSYYDVNLYTSTCFELLARVTSVQGSEEATLTYLDSAYQRLACEYGDENRREFGKFYCRAGEAYLRLGYLAQAQAAFQQALQAVLYGYTPQDLAALPEAAAFYAENTILEALSGMAELYQTAYQQQPVQAFLNLALQCHELIYTSEQALRRDYRYDSSKLFNLEESRERSEKAIGLAYQLHQLTGQASYLYQAFVFAERNRSSLLREAFAADQAAVLAGVSQAELQREKVLQVSVSEAEEMCFHLREEGAAADRIQQAEQEVLKTRDALGRWIATLETKHPRYYQLKYADRVPSLAELQTLLGKKQRLLEYFVGQQALYVFALDKQGLQLHALPLPDNLTQRVIHWRQSIEDYQQAASDHTALLRYYQDEGYQLYLDLVAPVVKLTDKPRELLIIPSGILDLLPFDALLTQAVAPGTNLPQYPYLLQQVGVSYSYSASLQWSLAHLPREGAGVLGFAPTFNGQHGWPALSCSAALLGQFTMDAADRICLGQEATITAFQTLAQQYQVLHLATHAQANPDEGDFSFIVFSDGRGGYDSLFAKDLYLLHIAAELVILSACETALGTLYNSEGVISLARAFHYAGARSVLTTLWRINENANCDLMAHFYAALYEGESKTTALHQAKLAYLNDADPRAAHPVYWAGFQLLGNPRPLRTSRPWYAWLGVVVLLLGLGGWRWRKNEIPAPGGRVSWKKMLSLKIPWSKENKT